ncbi:MAG: hypothetical protein ACM308_00810 [Qipengyuania vulgaris]
MLGVARQIAKHADGPRIVVNKSTVPVGTAARFELFGAQLRDRMLLARGEFAADVYEGRAALLAIDRFDNNIALGHLVLSLVQPRLALSVA